MDRVDMEMNWLDAVSEIEALEDAPFDEALVRRLQDTASFSASRPIRFSTPTFKEFSSEELSGCSKNSFPAFSITAGACALMCDHCEANILDPMIPATSPEMLEQKVRDLVYFRTFRGSCFPAARTGAMRSPTNATIRSSRS